MTIESMVQPKGLWRAFTSLRHRNYRLYWSGQVISLLGSSMQTIGLAWLVLEITHSAWQLGLVGALQAVPILLFSLFGGLVADRWPKRHVLFVTQAIAMLQALLLWVLTISGVIQVWHLYLLALLLGCMNCLYRPASSAFVVELVGREDLPNAVALNSSLSTLARIVGPGLAGIILAGSAVSVLFLINALSFLAVLIGLALIDNDKLHAQARQVAETGKRQSMWQSLREGFAYIGETPVVLLLLLVVGLVLLFGSNFNVVLPLFATDLLHMGTTGFGFLSAASSIGALLATLWLAWSSQKPTMRRMLLGTLIFAILELAFALSRLYPLSIALIASVGFAESTFAAQAITTLQTVVPDHLRGRVMSVQVLIFDGSLPLGYLLMGWLSALYGPTDALLTGALLSLLSVGGVWLWYKVMLSHA
ncbi:MFS transporter [Ktedonobacter racemifer]|uniref:Major facilitator superfamily MFS_1 n=1 Tax=Ktedonobacter racemifer DSM 44963 TaxID=485913 RepID=D6TV22_KTERA|nr:MFS transporter [Ktedonobacter racemifer]EFH84122.1 major facilitator superfamily MFS_1 [Ktedonobacter racemifer DSM 44963]